MQYGFEFWCEEYEIFRLQSYIWQKNKSEPRNTDAANKTEGEPEKSNKNPIKLLHIAKSDIINKIKNEKEKCNKWRESVWKI